MNLVNIPTGNRPCVAHFPGPTREKDFQKWMAEQIKTGFIPAGMPTPLEFVWFASSGRLASSPLIAQCAERGVPLTIIATTDRRGVFAARSFQQAVLLRDHILSARPNPTSWPSMPTMYCFAAPCSRSIRPTTTITTGKSCSGPSAG